MTIQLIDVWYLVGANKKNTNFVFRVLRSHQKQHFSDDSIHEMLEIDLDESHISSALDIDKKWELCNSLLEG